MINAPYVDASGFAFILLGIGLLLAAGYFLLVIVLFEAILLRALKWARFTSCLLNSFIVNLVSLFAGYLISRVLVAVTGIEIAEFISEYLWIYLVITWAVSILIEGGLLSTRNDRGLGPNMIIALVINTASYIPNGFILWLLAL